MLGKFPVDCLVECEEGSEGKNGDKDEVAPESVDLDSDVSGEKIFQSQNNITVTNVWFSRHSAQTRPVSSSGRSNN